MTALPALTGLVLAGGDSRRMGRDKARLPLDGVPLALHVARRLGPACRTVLVASGDGRRLADLGHPQVADAGAGRGPLAGIVAGLEAAVTPLVAVVAGDMPFADPRILALLAAAWRGEPAVVPSDGRRVHPLHGVYAVSAADRLRAALDAGDSSVHEVLFRLSARVVGPRAWRHLDATGRFLTNVNAPDDLRLLGAGSDRRRDERPRVSRGGGT